MLIEAKQFIEKAKHAVDAKPADFFCIFDDLVQGIPFYLSLAQGKHYFFGLNEAAKTLYDKDYTTDQIGILEDSSTYFVKAFDILQVIRH